MELRTCSQSSSLISGSESSYSTRSHSSADENDTHVGSGDEVEAAVPIKELFYPDWEAPNIKAETQDLYLKFLELQVRCIEQTEPHLKHKTMLTRSESEGLVAVLKQTVNTASDLLLAAQHPSPNQTFISLPHEAKIGVRLWKHGIRPILEIFREQLPSCREQFELCVHHSYAMIGVFHETSIYSELLWLQCLGDVACYMMVIEKDFQCRSALEETAKRWYQKALDGTPTIGHPSPHQPPTSRSAPLKELAYYIATLSTQTTFLSAQPHLSSFFKRSPHSSSSILPGGSSSWIEAMLLDIHALHFLCAPVDELVVAVGNFSRMLAIHVDSKASLSEETSLLLAIMQSAFVLHLPLNSGSDQRYIYLPVEGLNSHDTAYCSERDGSSLRRRRIAINHVFHTMSQLFRMEPTGSLLPYLHVTLVLLLHLTSDLRASAALQQLVPWEQITRFIQRMNQLYSASLQASGSDETSGVDKLGCGSALPEDYWLARVSWAGDYPPENHLDNPDVSKDEKDLQLERTNLERVRRCLRLIRRIAEASPNPPPRFTDSNDSRMRSLSVSHTRPIQTSLAVDDGEVLIGYEEILAEDKGPRFGDDASESDGLTYHDGCLCPSRESTEALSVTDGYVIVHAVDCEGGKIADKNDDDMMTESDCARWELA